MGTRFKLFSIALLSVLFVAGGCNWSQSDNYNDNNSRGRQERFQTLQDLQRDLEAYEVKIDATLSDRPTDFRERMYASLDSIRVRLDAFQVQMGESGGAYSTTTKRKIENLKIRRQQLHDSMNRWSPNDWDEVENIIMKNWNSFKKELDELTAGNDNSSNSEDKT